MEEIVALCKRRGFIYPGSEIYGGLTGTWDYGPLGVLLKNNIKQEWWKSIVQNREDVVGVDASIMMNPTVWEKSGHLDAFTDPLVECKNCHSRFRSDKLIGNIEDLKAVRREWASKLDRFVKNLETESDKRDKLLDTAEIYLEKSFKEKDEAILKKAREIIDDLINESKQRNEKIKTGLQLAVLIGKQLNRFDGVVFQDYLRRYVSCSNCGEMDWTEPKQFNLMVEAKLGVLESEKQNVFLRGEITQGAFVNFENVVSSTRVKIPFGIAQIGKAFRNEITPGNFTFRSREFEQMELEFFVEDKEKEADKWFDYWKRERMNWYTTLGITKSNLRFRKHEEGERAHYAKFAEDIEYNAPFGWSEFEGIHNRGDYDLKAHGLSYTDENGKKFVPWVIEASGGVDRSLLFFLIDAYTKDGERTLLKLNPKLAPYKVAVFPLLANKPQLVKKAKEIYDTLKAKFITAWDDRGNIGKRYYAQDEAGTPWCITIDFQSLEDDSVTVRDRDTATQERVKIDKLLEYFTAKLK